MFRLLNPSRSITTRKVQGLPQKAPQINLASYHQQALPPSYHHSSVSKRSLTTTPHHFSTQPPPQNSHPNNNPNPNSKTEPKNPNYFLEIWRGLNRPTKIVIIVFFLIDGTIETTFWLNVAWAKIQNWRGKGEEVDGGEWIAMRVWKRWFRS